MKSLIGKIFFFTCFFFFLFFFIVQLLRYDWVLKLVNKVDNHQTDCGRQGFLQKLNAVRLVIIIIKMKMRLYCEYKEHETKVGFKRIYISQFSFSFVKFSDYILQKCDMNMVNLCNAIPTYRVSVGRV